jgi:hypothetical protein
MPPDFETCYKVQRSRQIHHAGERAEPRPGSRVLRESFQQILLTPRPLRYKSLDPDLLPQAKNNLKWILDPKFKNPNFKTVFFFLKIKEKLFTNLRLGKVFLTRTQKNISHMGKMLINSILLKNPQTSAL